MLNASSLSCWFRVTPGLLSGRRWRGPDPLWLRLRGVRREEPFVETDPFCGVLGAFTCSNVNTRGWGSTDGSPPKGDGDLDEDDDEDDEEDLDDDEGLLDWNSE